MGDTGDSGGTKSVLIFLALIALIGLTCFAPIYKGKPLLHLILPDGIGPKPPITKPDRDLRLDKPQPPLETIKPHEERDLDQLIRNSKKKNKKK